MGVRMRVTLLFAGTLVALVSVLAVGLTWAMARSMDTAMDGPLRARADALAQQSPNGAGFQDGTLAASGLSPTDTLAQVVNASGRAVESSEGTHGALLLTPDQLRRARSASISVNSTLPTGEPIRLFAMPVTGNGQPPVVVVTGTSRRITLETMGEVRTEIIAGGSALAIIGALAAWFTVGATLRPIERMRAAAQRLSGDSLNDSHLPVPRGTDHVARLGHTLNDLIDRMRHAVQQQRRFVADASHELRTPLTMLRAELELGSRAGRSVDQVQQSLRDAHRDTERLVRLVNGLLMQATVERPSAGDGVEDVDLVDVAAEVVDVMARSQDEVSVVLKVSGHPVSLRAPRDRLVQLTINLVDNAIKASPSGGAVTVGVSGDHRNVTLSVTDEGHGFPEHFLPMATERLARADPARGEEGMGLGLSIVDTIAKELRGTLELLNGARCGATVRVAFPVTTLLTGKATDLSP